MCYDDEEIKLKQVNSIYSALATRSGFDTHTGWHVDLGPIYDLPYGCISWDDEACLLYIANIPRYIDGAKKIKDKDKLIETLVDSINNNREMAEMFLNRIIEYINLGREIMDTIKDKKDELNKWGILGVGIKYNLEHNQDSNWSFEKTGVVIAIGGDYVEQNDMMLMLNRYFSINLDKQIVNKDCMWFLHDIVFGDNSFHFKLFIETYQTFRKYVDSVGCFRLVEGGVQIFDDSIKAWSDKDKLSLLMEDGVIKYNSIEELETKLSLISGIN